MRYALALAVLAGGCGGAGVRTRVPDEAVRAGVDYLLAAQNRDGSWGSARNTTGFDVWAPVPGSFHAFRVATTALCVMALRQTGGPRAEEALRRGVDYLIANVDVKRQDQWVLYNVWAHTYAIQALAGEYGIARDERFKGAVERHIGWLARYESMYGGWNYYDFNVGAQRPSEAGTSFNSGAGVVALEDARAAGIAVPGDMVDRAVRLIGKCRKADGSYLYGYAYWRWPMALYNRPKGSLGRAQAPNCALYLRGKALTMDEVRQGLDVMFREHKFMDMGRKRQFPHEAWYSTSGYYYYFGHYYAARLIAMLTPADRARYAPPMLAAILPYQEPDGSWWDYAMYDYHKPYGTALALMALGLVR